MNGARVAFGYNNKLELKCRPFRMFGGRKEFAEDRAFLLSYPRKWKVENLFQGMK